MVIFYRVLLLCFALVGVEAFQSQTLRSFSLDSSSSLHAATGGGGQSRRDLFVEAGGLALSSVLLGLPLPAIADNGVAQTIVVTGANSGIGFEACKRLAEQGHTIVLACRTLEKSLGAAERLKSVGGSLIPAECDLTSLESIKAFADKLPSLVGNAKLDSLCLNAGIARNTGATDVARTKEGFELTGTCSLQPSKSLIAKVSASLLHPRYPLLHTVGTNHFGHFYLNHLLLPSIKPSGGRIIVTASGVHDPESPGGDQGKTATLGDLKGLEESGKACEMIDGGAFNADKAYKDSKVRGARAQ